MPTDFSLRLGVPPSRISEVERRYLQDVADRVNELPRFSIFSFSTPNSNVSAQSPALGFNEASAASRIWAKTIGSGNTGWVALA